MRAAVCLVLVCCGAASSLPAKGQEAATKAPVAAPAVQDASASVKSVLTAYVDAFNKHDADQISAQWSPEALWIDGETGERVEGREALIEDYREFFAANPEAELACTVNAARIVAPSVAAFEGSSVLLLPGVEPIQRDFNAILVERDGKWLFSSVTELEPPTGESAQQRLESLEFLIGSWVDEGEGPSVQTTVRWGAGNSFLVRSFTVEDESGELRQGTQVIGWDPLENRIRSWQFESDGSFGEGSWIEDGAEWVGRIRQTLADGSVASATQILRKLDDDHLEVATTGIEVDGAPLPSQPPVRVTRVVPADAEGAAAVAE
jgi:uncharacterized protein (TIGR02246 family)